MQGRTPALQNLGEGISLDGRAFSTCKQPRSFFRGLIRINRFQSIYPELLSSKSCNVQLFSGIKGELCHFRARRREGGRQIEGSVSQKRCNGDGLREILSTSRVSAAPVLQPSPCEQTSTHTPCKTLDIKDHKNKVQPVPGIFQIHWARLWNPFTILLRSFQLFSPTPLMLH